MMLLTRRKYTAASAFHGLRPGRPDSQVQIDFALRLRRDANPLRAPLCFRVRIVHLVRGEGSRSRVKRRSGVRGPSLVIATAKCDAKDFPALRRFDRRIFEQFGSDDRAHGPYPIVSVSPVEEQREDCGNNAYCAGDVGVCEPGVSIFRRRHCAPPTRKSSMSALLKLVCAMAGGPMPEAARNLTLWRGKDSAALRRGVVPASLCGVAA